MENLLQQIPKDIINFLLVTLFSMLIGLEQRRHHEFGKGKSLLGTDRTFTLIGIFGFILYLLDPEHMLFFGGGGLLIALYFGIFYVSKIWLDGQSGLTSILVGLITYCLAPLVYLQPPWLVLLILITVLVLVEIKESLIAISKKFDEDEFLTLAKFLAVAGVILPLTPNQAIIPGLELTPYKFWLAVVAVSTISYVSYLLRKFVFADAGLLLTGILGGMYSSTATTFTLAKKSHASSYPPAQTAGAIIVATAMMYLRILLLAYLFNREVATRLLLPFLILAGSSVGVGWYFYRKNRQKALLVPDAQAEHHNPLEFKTAFLFAFLFVLFAA
ncbi:MAG: MgtC/SapB family protein, partial [Saprospiraceae bacterium]